MTYDERVTSLINANSTNVIKRRALAKMLRDILALGLDHEGDIIIPGSLSPNNMVVQIEQTLKDNGP